MRTIGCWAVAAVLIVAFFSCSDLGNGLGSSRKALPMRPLTNAEKAVVQGNNAFGFKLLAATNQTAAGENLFISPLSVSMALGMTLNGANGATEEAMRSALEFAGIPQPDINQTYANLIALLTQLDPKVQMEIANSIWHRSTLSVEQEFKSVNASYFDALITGIDFSQPSAAQTINTWVSQSTHGKIATIVPDPIQDDVVMYLINAMYFKGTWTYQFDPSATHDDIFKLSNGAQVTCQMMTQEIKVPLLNYDGIMGVDLPYGDGGFSMTILLPPAGVNIDSFVASLTHERWNEWIGRFGEHEVALSMPKFTLEYETGLKKVLSQLGMGVAFTEVADFTGINRDGGLLITEVQHKTFVKVNEEGTEAAAVTSVGVGVTSIGGKVVLKLDRPFLYFIRERTSGAILFMGKMMQPVLG